jgi:acyl-CoA thioesterase II
VGSTTTPATPAATPGVLPDVVAEPCRYRARARWGDRTLAESAAAVRVERPGEAPLLCFPAADVRFDLLRDEGRTVTLPGLGPARLWSVAGDGRDVLWVVADPPPALARLRGLAAFDHDRACVEVVDAADGDADRDVTVKRFPTWGDAADLIDILDVRPAGERRWTTVARGDWRRPVVEGSQMLGQALVAAGRHAPGRRPVSAHMAFVRAADARRPLDVELDEVASGRTFSTVVARVGQDGRTCAVGTVLADTTAPDVIRHAAAPPDVAGPYDSPPVDMAVTGRDLRVVDGAYTGDPGAPVGPPTLDAWVRFRSVPDDPTLHAGLLAQFTGHLSIAAALRPHAGIGQAQAHRTLSTAINAIAISFHAEVHADRWMLYRHLSTVAGDGMTHAECRVHDEAGALVASFTVDAMVRAFAGSAPASDDRTAL